MKEKILCEYKKHKGRYGYRRITAALNKGQEEKVNHKKVSRLMRELNLQAKIRL
ncbi:MAG: IS3 family transposase [Syntrophothermus sp.]